MHSRGGGRDSGYPLLHWAPYEKIAKEIVFKTCAQFPLNCLKANGYYKPLSLIKNLGWAYGLRPLPADLDLYASNFKQTGDAVKIQSIETTKKLDENHQRAYLWSPISILLVIFSFISCSGDLTVLCGLLIFTIFSFIPSIIGYPVLHTIVDTIITVGILVYTSLNVILHKAFNFFFSRREANSINKTTLSYN